MLSDDEMFEIAIKVVNKEIGENELAIILKNNSIRIRGLFEK